MINMIEERIHIIIVKYLTKEASIEEETDLLAWLSQSEANRSVFRSLKDAFDLGQFEKHLKGSDTDEEWKKLLRRIQRISSSVAKPILIIRPFRKILRYAAIFVLGLLSMKAIDMLFFKKLPAVVESFATHIETGKGERSKLTLPDSTVVWLNACSSISYDQDFGKQTRTVNMRGEAYFNVRKDASKPFLVCTESLNYRVTGTSFNLYSFENENIESLVLVEGAVTLVFGNKTAEIRPGEIIEFDKTAGKINRRQINTYNKTGWRNGDLLFEEMNFEDLTKRLERIYNVSFVFENEKVKNDSFGGTFRHYDSLETILKVISSGTTIKYRIERDVVYIR